MQNDDTTSLPASNPFRPDWNFAEVWIDPMPSRPYILLLLSDSDGSCRVYDPAERKVIFTSATYDEAQSWLLEDEYDLVEGRLSAADL